MLALKLLLFDSDIDLKVYIISSINEDKPLQIRLNNIIGYLFLFTRII